jgi:hypothetical protein
MVWTVDWDQNFKYVVGGPPTRRLTPNFRLKEFQRADGSVRVHRELVSALQILRDRFGRSISVDADASVGDSVDGQAAAVRGVPHDELLSEARSLQRYGVFSVVEENGESVVVAIPDPDHLPPIDMAQALNTAFSVTSAFETTGDMFQQVTGNFDDAGLSFGPAQVNFRSGTLVPVFEEFRQTDEAALRACFDDPIDYEEWLSVMASDRGTQIEWADAISTGRGKHEVAEPWKGYLAAVGRVPAFRVIMVQRILESYGGKLKKALVYLREVRDIPIDHLRCICSLYDLVIQQGSLTRADAEIRARVEAEDPQNQFDLVRIAVEERGRKANERWRADCMSRRVGILEGKPVVFSESEIETQRANLNFYMLRDVQIDDGERLHTTDLSDEIARVSKAVAAGGTSLLA